MSADLSIRSLATVIYVTVGIVSAMLPPARVRADAASDRATLQAAEGKTLSGFEVELGPAEFARIINHFDVAEYARRRLHVGDIDDLVKAAGVRVSLRREYADGLIDEYLDTDPGNFFLLSEDIRAELSEGLKHFNRKLVLESGPKPVESAPETGGGSRILDAQGKPLRADAPRIILGNEPAPAPEAPRGLIVPDEIRAQADWIEIRRRWKALPRHHKVPEVRIDRLPYVSRAYLIINALGPLESLKLKADAPRAVREALAGLEWVKDQRSIEFRMRKPSKSPSLMLRKLHKLGDLTGIRDFRKASLHVHLSWPGRAGIEPYFRRFKMIKAIDIAREGVHVFGSSLNHYLHTLDDKAMARLVDPTRMEIREFTLAPEAELARAIRWEANPAESLRELDSRLAAFDPAWLDPGAHSSRLGAAQWEKSFARDLKQLELGGADVSPLLARLRAAALAPGASEGTRTRALRILASLEPGSKAQADLLAEALGSEHGSTRVLAIEALQGGIYKPAGAESVEVHRRLLRNLDSSRFPGTPDELKLVDDYLLSTFDILGSMSEDGGKAMVDAFQAELPRLPAAARLAAFERIGKSLGSQAQLRRLEGLFNSGLPASCLVRRLNEL